MNRAGAPRGRSLHWLQALVLLVLLTGVVGPAPVRAIGADPVVEAVLERGVSRSWVIVGREPRPAVVAASQPKPTSPRPAPRTRSVHARGLPPPRAPTA
jgi:hypothetical protein